MAIVHPFPAARRVRLIKNTAAAMADAGDRGEKIIAATLQQQADAMARKGIKPDVVRAEIFSLELAIRAHLRNWNLRSGGAA